jgi:hypothetical protein
MYPKKRQSQPGDSLGHQDQLAELIDNCNRNVRRYQLQLMGTVLGGLALAMVIAGFS